MTNRTAAWAVLLLALTSTARAGNTGVNAALQEVGGIAAGGFEAYDGARTAPKVALCEGVGCRINQASNGAMSKGNLVVSEGRIEVPTPKLTDGKKEGSKGKSGLFSGKGMMYALGGALTGAGIGWHFGGLIGALIGAAVGALAGLVMSKMLSKKK